MINKQNIKDLFLQLTSKTYPHGTEFDLRFEEYLPNNKLEIDYLGNYFIKIGESSSIFTSHLDTADYSQKKVNHVIDGDFIRTDGTSILGADDKAGVVIMINMINHNIPGLYYFFVGEEVGRYGSKGAVQYFPEVFSSYNRMVSFDRRGYGSIITHQLGYRTCSKAFGESLNNMFLANGLKCGFLDDGGIYTDSFSFKDIIPECTNISVGYFMEHTQAECQDINYLTSLVNAVLKVDWESLPTDRDLMVIEEYYEEDDLVYDYYFDDELEDVDDDRWEDDFEEYLKYMQQIEEIECFVD